MKHRRAFTLVELLVVVIVLAILAAIVVPSFSDAALSARSSMLKDNLRTMRTQIEVFKAQHRDVPPGYPDLDISATPTEEAFVLQMKLASTESGETAPAGTDGYPYGPYLREIPENPINGLATVRVLGDDEPFPSTAANTHGYVYQPASCMLKADSLGADENKVAYFDY